MATPPTLSPSPTAAVSPIPNSTASPPAPVAAAPPPTNPTATAPAPAPAAAPPPSPETVSSPPPATSPPSGSNSTSPPPTSPPPTSPPASTSPSTPSSSTPPPPSTSKPSPPPPPSTSTTSPPPPSSSGASPTPSPPSSSSISTGAVVGIAVGGIAVILVVILLFCCCRKKKRRGGPEEGAFYGPSIPPPKVDTYGGRQQQWQQTLPTIPDDHIAHQPNPSPSPEFSSQSYNVTSGGESLSNFGVNSPMIFSKNTFSYEELARATSGFSDANLLGQGGFGYVHRGVLPNGKEIAVKQLKAGSGQGEREFQAEVEIISRVHHKHLVSLVGYCITGTQRLLVYEYVPNNTLEFHLHGKGRPTMDWPTRLKIALGAAKGLAYLHEDCHPKIIHRDIKGSNILLDNKFEAKVADFGLAKLSSDTNTHVSTRVMGTFGYLAPEYASSGKLTDKSDVFSYGVMLLELITGRRPVDTTNTFIEDSLVDWARPLLVRALEDGNYDGLVDPNLDKNFDENEMARMVASAAACVRHSAKRRPKMSLVVRALEGEMTLTDLNEGIKPGHSRVYGSYGSSDYDSTQYKEDMKIFRRLALGSQEQGSSEVSSSQYGAYPSGSSSESQPL